MKTYFVSAVFAFASFLAISQNNGFILYDIEIKGITPELNKGAAMLTNSSMRVAFGDSAVRQDYVLGTMVKKTTILNFKMNQGIFYEDGFSGKYGVFGSCDQIEQLVPNDTTTTVELLNETKVILTYKCKKALLHFKTGETAEYWYTTEFPVQFPKDRFFNAKIPGVILEFSTTANGFFMRFKCSNYGNLTEDLSKFFLPLITRDYKMIDFNSYIQYLYLQQQKK